MDDAPRWNSRSTIMTAVVLVLAFAAGSYIQFGMLEKLKPVVISAMDNVSVRSLAGGKVVRSALSALAPLDWGVVGFCVLLLVFFIVIQAKFGAVAGFFRLVLREEWRTLVFLLFVCALMLKPILAPGMPYLTDAPSHVSRAWYSYLNLAQGYVFPSFTNYYHNGFALFSHYGWLPSYCIALANLGLRDIVFASKLVVFLFSVGNALLFYALGKRIFASRRGALLLALIFVTSNLYLYEIAWTGLLFFPWIFLGAAVMLVSLESWFSSPWKLLPGAFMTAVGAAILVNTHLGYSAQFLLFFAVYATARMLFFFRGRIAGLLGFAATAMSVGAVLSAFVFLPTILDIHDVNFYKAFPFADLSTYTFWRAHLWNFLVPRPFYSGLDLDYLGLGLVAAAVFCAVRFAGKKNKWFRFCLVLLLFCLLVINYSRNSFLVLLSVALLVAGGYVHLMRKGDVKLGVFAVFAMALMIDAFLFNNFNTTDTRGGDEKAVYARLTAEPDGSRYGVVMANTLHTGNEAGSDVFVSPWLKIAGFPILQPNAIMLEANKQALYQYGFTSDLLVPDIQAGRVSPLTVQALDMIGVKYMTFHTASQYFVPPLAFDHAVRSRPDGPWVELPLTSPVIFAPSTANVDELSTAVPALKKRAAFESDDVSHSRAPFKKRPDADAYLGAVVEATGLDPRTANARQFLLRAGHGENLGEPGTAAVKVSRFAVDSQKVVVDFSIDRIGFVAVPFGYFKWQKVLLDGRPVAFQPTVMNTICLKIEAPGRHTLTIGPAMSPARRLGAIVSLAGLALFGVLLLVLRLARRPR